MKSHLSDRQVLTGSAADATLAGPVSTQSIGVGNRSGERPNILWLVSEDHNPLIGVYGDDLADTPNIEALAQRGILYRNAYSNTPVCAHAVYNSDRNAGGVPLSGQ